MCFFTRSFVQSLQAKVIFVKLGCMTVVVLYTNCVSNSHALRQAWIIFGTEKSPRIPAETVLSFVKIGKLKVLLHL